MQDQKTWTIIEIRDGEENEVRTGLSQVEAVSVIRRAMYGDAASLLAPSETSVHELPLAA